MVTPLSRARSVCWTTGEVEIERGDGEEDEEVADEDGVAGRKP